MSIASLFGFIILIITGNAAENSFTLFSSVIYGVSIVLLFTFSSLYHLSINVKTKKIFQILDHCGIYIMIAGSYTPVMLVAIGGTTGWLIFGIQWVLALIGIILKLFYTGRFNLLSTLMYAVMGWLILVRWQELVNSIPDIALTLLLTGGISYTIGIVFYLLDSRVRFAHFIWHLFVIAGSLLHYYMIVEYIIV